MQKERVPHERASNVYVSIIAKNAGKRKVLITENSIALCAETKPCVIYLANGTRDVQPEESFNL